MKIGGFIKINHPELKRFKDPKIEKLHLLLLTDDQIEFTMALVESEREETDFNLWFKLQGEDVSIETDVIKGRPLKDFLAVAFKDSTGRKVELVLSLEQVNALSNFLTNYTTAFYSEKALQQKRSIEVESESRT